MSGNGHKQNQRPQNLGELKSSGYKSRPVHDELRENLSKALVAGTALFPGIIGYDQTVIPALINAVLSKHDILLLGLRGQAKTRLLRQLVQFLDEWMPAIAGSTLHEDPFNPITKPMRDLVEAMGRDTPIAWIHRSQRFNEKLATPDIAMVDLIGDIDPIRAAREKLDLSDERVIHYGIIPRTHRGIFLINELADLQTRIQVGLLNILEERDLQIRGFPMRLPLDIMMLFTANPEDYTNRGNIITPLKDRIDSQIMTHYPRDIEDAVEITRQEARIARSAEIHIPDFMRELVEEVAVQARGNEHVDQSSGVSARLSISLIELMCSNVERRLLQRPAEKGVVRLPDLFAGVPAICGKVELVYEGEQEGTQMVAAKLIGKAVGGFFVRRFPPVHENKKKAEVAEPLYAKIQNWFSKGGEIRMTDHRPLAEERAELEAVDGLAELVRKFMPLDDPDESLTAMQIVLEALHQHALLSRQGLDGAFVYGDMLREMLGESAKGQG